MREGLPDLPVTAVLPELLDVLAGAGGATGAAVLVAPPGTGKTTIVPLALADRLGGRVVVAEPRRVAARAAAQRMSDLLGSPLGERVGFTVKGEHKVSSRTEVEVVTTGVLVQRLLRDADLVGVSAVVVDECHERHLDTDLVLAFLTEVRAVLRPDLAVLATSATAARDDFARALGEHQPAPVIAASVPAHPLRTVWAPPSPRTRPAHGLWVDPTLLDHVCARTLAGLREQPGDALVIVPGVREIEGLMSRLRSGATNLGVDVVPLHGRLSSREQDAALRPGPRRRVVVATALAESSLTVPGVRLVVDAGLARRPRVDHARGLSALVTATASRAEAEQRAGRAHREGPGTVVRCWTEGEHERRAAFPPPAVEQADLTGYLLALAVWGALAADGRPSTAGLPSQPPDGPTQVALSTLQGLGALDGRCAVTARGRLLAHVPAHPRLAAALLDATRHVGRSRAAEAVALLADDRSGSPRDGDLMAGLRAARAAADPQWRNESRRLAALVPDTPRPAARGVSRGSLDHSVPDDEVLGRVVGAAYPERLARRRDGGTGYLMVSGTGAELPAGSALAGAQWVAVAAAERGTGRASAVIRSGVAVAESLAVELGAQHHGEADEVRWESGDVVARRVRRLGAIVLSVRPLRSPDPVLVHAAVLDDLKREGMDVLRWGSKALSLRARMAFLHDVVGDPWPGVDDASLLERLDQWWPRAGTVRNRADLVRLDAGRALQAVLPWPQAVELDALAPERVRVPTGSSVRLDYSGAQPVLAVRVQEVFGWSGPPALAAGRTPVLLHLLSPAGRPAAVTADLASFWTNGYPGMRADLRGRYPKHPWPQDPTTARPTSRTTARVSTPRDGPSR